MSTYIHRVRRLLADDVSAGVAERFTLRAEGAHMEFLTQLWLPIVVSAALVWIASAIIWTALPYRHAEWSKLPNEEGFLSFLTQGGIKPGNYMFPCECDGKQITTPM